MLNKQLFKQRERKKLETGNYNLSNKSGYLNKIINGEKYVKYRSV